MNDVRISMGMALMFVWGAGKGRDFAGRYPDLKEAGLRGVKSFAVSVIYSFGMKFRNSCFGAGLNSGQGGLNPVTAAYARPVLGIILFRPGTSEDR